MVYLLALLAALAFALGTVLQQKGTLDVPAAEGDPRFFAQIIGRPVWLAGAGCQTAGWVLQAVALDKGSLIVVQSLTTLSLVIALPLGVRMTKQDVDRRVWLGALGVVVGIVLFLSAGFPKTGTYEPTPSAWWTAGLGSLVLILILAGIGRNQKRATKALLFGTAAGICFALQASGTKVFVTLVGKGLSTILTSWTIWVLIASALGGFVLQQSALKTGVLAPAMASSNAMTLFASVVFGLTIFDETLSDGDSRLALAIIGLGIALVGIALLAGAKPPDQDTPLTTPAQRSQLEAT
jgi:drug/metabolite transporter (DMT)-like permease